MYYTTLEQIKKKHFKETKFMRFKKKGESRREVGEPDDVSDIFFFAWKTVVTCKKKNDRRQKYWVLTLNVFLTQKEKNVSLFLFPFFSFLFIYKKKNQRWTRFYSNIRNCNPTQFKN